MSEEILSFSHKDTKPTVVVKTENNWIYSAEGNRSFDSLCNLWSMPLGHSCPELKEAFLKQMEKSVCYNNFFHTQNQASLDLVQSLSRHFNQDISVYFSSSGSSANALALTMACKYNRAKGKKRDLVLSLSYGYHGTCLLSSYVSDQWKERFSDLKISNLRHKIIPIEDRDGLYSLKRLIHSVKTEESAGIVIIEPCIGSGGVYPFLPEELDQLLTVCREREITTIFDEIITAFGNSETPFYTDQCRQRPDFITLGKAMTNGWFPHSATVLFNRKIREAFEWFNYGYTFSSHPLGSALAVKMLDIIKSGKYKSSYSLIEQGVQSIKKKQKSYGIRHIRRNGLMLAFEFAPKTDTEAIERQALLEGIILCGAYNNSKVVGACLPLSAGERDYNYFFEQLSKVFRHFRVL